MSASRTPFCLLYNGHQIVKHIVMAEFRIEKVVSGGQTGVDRVALDVAIYLDIPHGGWCPRGRRAEDGRIPDSYKLKETSSRDYATRTEQNIVDSDGTLILYANKLSGGSGLTLRLAQIHHRPVLCVDLASSLDSLKKQDIENVTNWLESNGVRVLNVAGPRASSKQDLGRCCERFLLQVLEKFRRCD